MLSGASSPQVRPGIFFLGRLFCFILPILFAAPCASAELTLALVGENGQTLYSAPVKNGDTFAIRYQHSVALSPVTDYFVIRDNEIWLDKTVYQDFGAGLPHEPGPGQKLSQRNGRLELSGFNRKLGSFQLRVGRVANHVLMLGPQNAKKRHDWLEVPLNEYARPGSAITFVVRSGQN